MKQKQPGGKFVNDTNDIMEEIKNQVRDYMGELTSMLSKGLNESASEYGAITRKREVKDAKLLFQSLLVYAISGLSLKMLSVCAFLMNAGNISDQAWKKKLCVAYLG